MKASLEYRSDTFTQPTPEMKEAMVTAVLGDDVYGEDPTVNELESFAASLVGKEAALFVPTCTMANLIAVSVHCTKRYSEYIVGNKQHMHAYEVGGSAAIAGVHSNVLCNNPDGTLPLDAVERAIRDKDIHFPHTQMIAIENTNNICGGRVLGVDYLSKLGALAHKNGVKLHMDGARLFNAATTLNISAAALCKPVDSVSICLSKGLAAPVGALLVGSKEFITEARHARKALGGGMRQAGVIAACGLVALQTMRLRLGDDHLHAKKIAEGLQRDALKSFYEIKGGLEAVESNFFFFAVKDGKAGNIVDEMKNKHGVLLDQYGSDMIRLVAHKDVDIANAEKVVEALRESAAEVFTNS